MALKAETSLMLSAATVGLVYGTYQHFMPAVIDNRTMGYNDPNIATSERQATWTAAAVVSGVALLGRDPIVFMVGGFSVVVLAWMHRAANMHQPDGSTSMVPASPDALSAQAIGYEPTAG